MFQQVEYIIKEWLNRFGFSGELIIFLWKVIEIAAIILLAFLVYHITRLIVLRIVHSIARKTKTLWDDVLVEHKFFNRLSYLVPACTLFILIPLALQEYPAIERVALIVVKIYGLFIAAGIINSFLKASEIIYQRYEMSKSRPIKGYLQIVKIIVYTIIGIILISLLINKPPLTMLAGMGAMSAVLMLIFKDSILGFVGGIQLAANDMLRKGDWITMPKYGADGTVMDIALTTIKVRNFDNTITTIPTYTLISDSFQNWRGMDESGVRRIKRSVNIDMTTIRLCTPEMLEKFKMNPLLKEYIESHQKEIDEQSIRDDGKHLQIMHQRSLTNLNIFMVYLKEYLKLDDDISKENTLVVRQLQPLNTGLPVEVYAFSKIQEWKDYEEIQGEIMNHVLAIIPYFGLKVFQNPTGADIALGFHPPKAD
ncbi:MAG: mechanosensitive ion channel [Bacteroidetes bacterium]|nr:mechanosensitive ion channel [Bacteroidota bacterium]